MDASVRRWRLLQQLMKGTIVLYVGVMVWLFAIRPSAEPAPVIVEPQLEFSLDLRVVDAADHDVVYVVEQRARPHYRIFSFDPRTGETNTVFSVPEKAIVYGIALSPDRDTLAVAYSPDYDTPGAGLWLLDLASGDHHPRLEVTESVYLTDLTWSEDGDRVLATRVDRRNSDETLASIAISADAGEVEVIATNAINPVEASGEVFVLDVGEDKARRSVVQIGEDVPVAQIGTDAIVLDLDHLLAAPDGTLHVAALDPPDDGIGLGTTAEAHGSHEVPSTWYTLTDSGAGHLATGLAYEPIIVFDAVATSDGIVYATKEGLSFASGERVDVIASRAIRFVAG